MKEGILNKSGIYIIINTKNSKVYIGQSINVKQRVTGHFNSLKNNKHNNIYFQNSYNKYGRDIFKVEVLCYCSIEELSKEESLYIKKYNSSNRKFGYNLTEDCHTHILKTRKRIGNKNKALLIKNNIIRKQNARKVIQYSLDGKYIKVYGTCLEIMKDYKLSIGNLNTYLNKFTTTKSLVGFMWKWCNGETNDITPYKQGKPKKSIEVYNNGILYKKFDKIKDACEDLKINRSTIERSIKGIAINSKGLTFKIIK